MIIIPAIDIKNSQCVRLRQGKAEHLEVFSSNPLTVALEWERKGAKRLHIVDLDGAFQGQPVHKEIIKEIVKQARIPIQVGGGLRDRETIKQFLDWGIDRVIVGTLLSESIEKIKALTHQFGEKLIAGIDIKDHLLAVEGWNESIQLDLKKWLKQLPQWGVRRIIYTDISRDGMLVGPNLAMIRWILEQTGVKIIASGGISRMGDLYQLKQIEHPGLEGVIIGKALYKGYIQLEEANRIMKNGEDK